MAIFEVTYQTKIGHVVTMEIPFSGVLDNTHAIKYINAVCNDGITPSHLQGTDHIIRIEKC